MPYADPVRQKQYQTEWYGRQKQTQMERQRTRRSEVRGKLRDYKLEKGCTNCGYAKCAAALDAHHPEGKESKKDQIYRMLHRNMSWEKIYAELERCTILCSNCHREAHDNDDR